MTLEIETREAISTISAPNHNVRNVVFSQMRFLAWAKQAASHDLCSRWVDREGGRRGYSTCNASSPTCIPFPSRLRSTTRSPRTNEVRPDKRGH